MLTADSPTSRHARIATLLSCCALVLIWSQHTLAKPSFSVRPPQPWVLSVSTDPPDPNRTVPSSGSSFVLDDHQTRVSGTSVDRYTHHVIRIDTTAGLNDLSQLRFSFEPTYQKLTIHFIRIQRGDITINALKPSEVKIIQQEEELDQQLYNGTLSALIFLSDLRIGDLVDYAYTVSGDNPVLGGRFVDSFYLADGQPIEKLHLRLVWPSHRQFVIWKENTDTEPSISTSTRETEYSWELSNVPAIEDEDGTPDWLYRYPTVNFTEFQSWQEVVEWGLSLYKSSRLPDEMTSKVAHWRNALPSQPEQLIAALRFVQDEIRYLGIDLGEYSHKPNPPAKVLARRFGDCKDKSLLLATILQNLDIDAAPALVDTMRGRTLGERMPSPYEFDHVIVRVRLDGRTYWLDPTISYQRGNLGQYYDPPFENALVIQQGNYQLEKIPLPGLDSASTTVNEVFEIKDGTGAIAYTVTSIYRGIDADAMRHSLSLYSREELAKYFLNYYADSKPSIRPDGSPQIEDDAENNTLVTVEKYFIDEFWNEGKHRILADRILAELKKPNITKRQMPLVVNHPMSLKQSIEINLPQAHLGYVDQGNISDGAFSLKYSHSQEGSRIRLDYSLETLADHVSAENVPRHLEIIDKSRNLAIVDLETGTVGVMTTTDALPAVTFALALWFIVAGLIVLGAVVTLLRFTRKSQGEPLSGRFKPQAGQTPETAITVIEEQVEGLVKAFRCQCGKNPYTPETPLTKERFTYDGESLVGIRLLCSCGKTNDLYLNPQTSSQEKLATL